MQTIQCNWTSVSKSNKGPFPGHSRGISYFCLDRYLTGRNKFYVDFTAFGEVKKSLLRLPLNRNVEEAIEDAGTFVRKHCIDRTVAKFPTEPNQGNKIAILHAHFFGK
jgi:hypothetical protein